MAPPPAAPHVAALHVHPVKSLRGVAVAAAAVGDLGLALDRRWMLVDDAGVFLTQREDAGMTRLAVALVDRAGHATNEARDDLRVRVAAPDGATLDLDPPPADAPRRRVRIWSHTVDACTYPPAVDGWFAARLGRPCALVWMPDDVRRPIDHASAGAADRAPFSDGFPALVVTEGSLADLNARLARRGHPPVGMARFRPNVVVGGAEPYAEDGWATLDAGDVSLALVKPCGRCVVTTLDPHTGAGGVEPLRTLAEYRRAGTKVVFAQNALVRGGGTIRVGDRVSVTAAPPPA